MEGSLAMGMGEALFEGVKFDERGRVINSDLAEYKLVTALDMPPVEAIIVESDEPNGPFGAKEVGKEPSSGSTMEFRTLQVERNPLCPVCGGSQRHSSP